MEHNAEGKSERDDETDRMLCPDAWGGICDTDCGYCGGKAYIKAGTRPDPFRKYIGADITDLRSHTAKARHPSNRKLIG